MRKFLLLTASVGALGLALTAAQAADVIPEPVPEPTWTGFHIGIGGGAGFNTYEAESDFCADTGSQCEDGDFESANILMGISADDLGAWYGFGTVEAGFDWQIDSFLIGILGNYDFNGDSSADAEAFSEEDDGDFTESTIEAEVDDTWFLGGRLGFIFNEDSLIYVLGGYTWADANVKSTHEFEIEDGGFDDRANIDEDESVDGWTIGGGLEHLLTENVSLKLEYRHDFLGDVDWDECGEDDDGPDCENIATGEVDFGRDTIRAVISWRFNPWGM
jgi:outer membrane immunogenic protein